MKDYIQHSILDEVRLEDTDYISVDHFIERLVQEIGMDFEFLTKSLAKVGKANPEDRNQCMLDILTDIDHCKLRSIMNSAEDGEFTIGYYNMIT